jgi:periodic tryptophan protein 2
MTARIYSLHPIEGFTPVTLSGHKNYVIGAYFSADQETVSKLVLVILIIREKN